MDKAAAQSVNEEPAPTKAVIFARVPPGFWFLCIALVFAGAYAWLFRFDVRPLGGEGSLYVHDRWTGNVEYCVKGGGCTVVVPPSEDAAIRERYANELMKQGKNPFEAYVEPRGFTR